MAELNNELFNQLLNEGKYQEAKEILKSFVDSEWTKEDEGAYYVDLVTKYINMSNTINEAYIEELIELKQALEDLDQIQNEADKNTELSRIRDEISKL